ncbi:serine-rich adhesin for platelets-like [Penaeus chinensis]|uniref:serine-rich adhesin for platelets-like n=1 Tax=Penaeus chinensis TaxID=139456 RepID=UPI001FB601FF|nr:serine-rich adhesin for platelets-like [Penaeus chinensis]
MWAYVFLACLAAGVVKASSPYCIDIDKKTGRQLCCPPGNDGYGECVEYLPKNSLRHMKGVESIEEFNGTKAYVVSPPQDSDESCCCLEEKERMLLKSVVAEGGETYEVAQSDPDMVQPVETVTCRLIPCITPPHRQDKGISCSQKWSSWEVYAKDPTNEDMLRVVSFKVPSGCLCDSDAENVEDRKLQDPSAYDMDHWLQTEVRRLFLNAGDNYDTHSKGKDPRTLRYPVKRQIHQGGEAMSTVRILALILSKVEPSDRLPIFQEVKGIMSEKVSYMREARKIIEAIFGGGGTADETTDVSSSDGSTRRPDASPQSQETDDTLKVKIIQFLLRRAMAEVMCNATVVVKLDEHKTPSFLPQEFVKEMQQNEKVTVSPIASLLVSTALRCRDTDVLQAIRDGRLARMIVAAETVSEGIAKVLDDSDGKISAVFQLASDNTTAASLTVIDENKVAEIQGFFDRVLEATGNSGSMTDTTVWTAPTEKDKQSTSGMPRQETTTLPAVTSDPITVTPSKAPASEEPMRNPVIPPKEQLPSSEYLNFNDTGAVLSSFLNVTGDPWPLTETSAGGKPVKSTTSVPTTMSISEVKTEDTLTSTTDFPSTVTVEISENPVTFTGSSDTVTTESTFSGTTTSSTDETPYSSLAVTEETVTEYPASVTEEEATASLGVSTEMTYTVSSTDFSKSQTETTTNTFDSSVSESMTASNDEETEGDDFLTSDSIAMGITTEGTVTKETGTTEAITETTTTEESSTESVTEAIVTGESTPKEIFTEETATTAAISEESTPRETATEGTVTEELTSEEMVTEETIITEESTDSETATEGAVTQESTDSETATEGAVTQESTDIETATEGAVTQESTDSETATEGAVTQESTDSETATEGAVTQESTDSETATEGAVTQESTDSETATEGAVTQESTDSETATEGTVTQESTDSETATEGAVTQESTDSETATEGAVTQESTDSETATEGAVTQESTDSETATEGAVTQESTDSETATEGAVTQESTDSETATEGAVTQESTDSETATEAAVTHESTPKETITETVTKESTSVTEIIESTTEATAQVVPHDISLDLSAPPVIPSEEELPKTEYEPLNVPVEFILHFLS